MDQTKLFPPPKLYQDGILEWDLSSKEFVSFNI